MQENHEIAVNLLQFSDQDYFAFSGDKRKVILDKLLVMNQYQGALLGSPAQIDIEKQERLPLLWATRTSNLRSWQVVTLRNSSLVVVDLFTGKVTLQNAFFGPKKIDYQHEPKSAEGSLDDVLAPKGATADCEVLDVRAIANIPWHAGRYAISLLMYDWLSNTVTVELQQNGKLLSAEQEQALQIPRTEALQLMQDYQRMATATFPAFNFSPSAHTPKLQQQNLALTVSESVSRIKRRWFVEAAARLKLLPGNIVTAIESALASDVTQKIPYAVINLSLLVVQIDTPVPRQIAIQVPVFSAVPLKVGDEVDIAFHVDIKSALRSDLPPGQYQIYLVANDQIIGPYAIHVI